METREETTAEIALGVRKATRERAETEIAEGKALKCELEKEQRALIRERKSKLATFYYGLSTFFLTSTGVGGLSPIVLNTGKDVNWFIVFLGFIIALLSAYMANKTLKYKINE